MNCRSRQRRGTFACCIALVLSCLLSAMAPVAAAVESSAASVAITVPYCSADGVRASHRVHRGHRSLVLHFSGSLAGASSHGCKHWAGPVGAAPALVEVGVAGRPVRPSTAHALAWHFVGTSARGPPSISLLDV